MRPTQALSNSNQFRSKKRKKKKKKKKEALDRVIEEARSHGIRLILSLVNNLDAYGGKSQYVKWAWEEEVGVSASNDSFFFDPSIKSYFKSYLKSLLDSIVRRLPG